MLAVLALLCALAFMDVSSGQFNFQAMEARDNQQALEFRAYQIIPRHTLDLEAVEVGSNVYSFRAAPLDTPEAATDRGMQEQGVQQQPRIVNTYEKVDENPSLLDIVKQGVVLQALLPLVTMAPLLVSAGLEADVDWSLPAAPKVSFPKLGQTQTVHMLKCFV